MRVNPTRSQARAFLAAGLLLLLAAVPYGPAGAAQDIGVTLNNECKQVRPSLYQCVIYLEAARDVLDNIDDVRYTLPYGYESRKQTVGRGRGRPFSSEPFNTAEEVTVNVKIDFKGNNDAYLSYRVTLSNERLGEARVVPPPRPGK